MPWNECVRRVRASGYAMGHFWRMGDLNIRFWGENGENPWPKHAKTRVSERCAWSGALGAHLLGASARRCTPGARRPNRNNRNVVPRSGAWGQSCGGPLRPFEGVLLLFWPTLLLEHILLGQNLDFPIGLKLEFVTFRFFGICRKMNFYEQKGLHGWSTVHMELDKACKVGTMS